MQSGGRGCPSTRSSRGKSHPLFWHPPLSAHLLQPNGPRCGGLGLRLSNSEGWNPPTVGVCGCTRCPQNGVLSHKAQDMANAWFEVVNGQCVQIRRLFGAPVGAFLGHIVELEAPRGLFLTRGIQAEWSRQLFILRTYCKSCTFFAFSFFCKYFTRLTTKKTSHVLTIFLVAISFIVCIFSCKQKLPELTIFLYTSYVFHH